MDQRDCLTNENYISLSRSGITKQEMRAKPQEILNVLLTSTGRKKALPQKKETEQKIHVLDFKYSDPSDDFVLDAKVGKGGQSLVFSL